MIPQMPGSDHPSFDRSNNSMASILNRNIDGAPIREDISRVKSDLPVFTGLYEIPDALSLSPSFPQDFPAGLSKSELLSDDISSSAVDDDWVPQQGMLFDSMDAFTEKLKGYAYRNGFGVSIRSSEKSKEYPDQYLRTVWVCQFSSSRRLSQGESCPFTVRVAFSKPHSCYRVGKVCLEHNHPSGVILHNSSISSFVPFEINQDIVALVSVGVSAKKVCEFINLRHPNGNLTNEQINTHIQHAILASNSEQTYIEPLFSSATDLVIEHIKAGQAVPEAADYTQAVNDAYEKFKGSTNDMANLSSILSNYPRNIPPTAAPPMFNPYPMAFPSQTFLPNRVPPGPMTASFNSRPPNMQQHMSL